MGATRRLKPFLPEHGHYMRPFRVLSTVLQAENFVGFHKVFCPKRPPKRLQSCNFYYILWFWPWKTQVICENERTFQNVNFKNFYWCFLAKSFVFLLIFRYFFRLNFTVRLGKSYKNGSKTGHFAQNRPFLRFCTATAEAVCPTGGRKVENFFENFSTAPWFLRCKRQYFSHRLRCAPRVLYPFGRLTFARRAGILPI